MERARPARCDMSDGRLVARRPRSRIATTPRVRGVVSRRGGGRGGGGSNRGLEGRTKRRDARASGRRGPGKTCETRSASNPRLARKSDQAGGR
eukprot:29216-Pelagococcus_subviridis.AAC.2